jgi:hypothetical protein|tara:strand:+ start:3788 stop:4000 length:213 start_codon:yes stop_codon:yes gene_type:complete
MTDKTIKKLLQDDTLNYLAWELQKATQELKEENDKADRKLALLKEPARDVIDLEEYIIKTNYENWRLANE